MADKRIIEQTATSEVFVDDWLVKDSSTEGTTKIRPSNLKDYIADGLVPETMVADEYVTTSTYDSGDICIYEGVLYKALEDDITGDWDSTKWDAITISSELANTGTTASDVQYDNSSSTGVQATNVQDALDEAFERTVVLANGLTSAFNTVAETYTSAQHNYTKGDYVLYETKLYRCIENTSGTWDSTKWEEVKVTDEIKDIQTDVDNKADVDGMYEELFAGNLVTDMHTADNSPYVYRQSPSGNLVSQNIVGGTVAWNQLVQNGNFASTSGWSSEGGASLSVNNNTCTITGSSSNSGIYQQFNFSSNHKVLITAEVKNATENNTTIIRFGGNNVASITGTTNWTKATIIYNTSSSTNYYTIRVGEQTAQARNCMLIDLTQVFGSTIADYIYSLEQATAGSGIAWLKSYGFLTKDYYAYDSGELQSVNVSARKVVGFNQWDEEWVNGYRNSSTGAIVSNPNNITNKNPISVTPNTSYYIKVGIETQNYIVEFDKNGEFLRAKWITYNNVFTTSIDCYYIAFSVAVSTYNNDICINISDASKNGTYEPYTLTTYNLSGEHEVNRKFGVVDLGTLTWSKGAAAWNTSSLSTLIKLPATNNDVPQLIISSKPYKPVSSNMDTGVAGTYEVVINRNNGNLSWRYPIDAYTDAATFKTAMNGVYLIYELATPTSESVTNPELRGVLKLDANNKLYYYGDTMSDIPNPQLVGSTEEFIDGATRDVPIPVGGERKYYTDLKAKLEELAKIPSVPTTNGTYTLKATRSASGVTYSWISG